MSIYSAKFMDDVLEESIALVVSYMVYLRDQLTVGGRVVGQRKLTPDEQRERLLMMRPEQVAMMAANRPRAMRKAERLLEVEE